MPAVGLESLGAVLGEGDVGAGGQRHVVVVVKEDQLAQLEMTGQRGGFRRDAFHQVAVAGDAEGGMVDQVETGAVVARGQVRFGNRFADRIGKSLSQRAGAHLDPRGQPVLGMTGRDAAPLPKLLDLFQRQIVARQVQQTIQQHRAVSGREHEAVAIEPLRMGRVVTEVTGPEHVGHGGGAHRQPGVPAVGLLHGIYRKEADRIDAQSIQLAGGASRRCSGLHCQDSSPARWDGVKS